MKERIAEQDSSSRGFQKPGASWFTVLDAMTYAVVPKEIGARGARVWAGTFDAGPEACVLTIEPGGQSLPINNWTDAATEAPDSHLWFELANLTGLVPDTRYDLELSSSAGVLSTASLRTLPEELPRPGERPFRLFLASCFHVLSDAQANAGRTFAALLRHQLRPDVAVFCGDQVYLDMPANDFILHEDRSPAELEAYFVERYRKTWTQRPGFQDILSTGGNCFTSDDHEFWNNYPEFSVLAPMTWSDEGRSVWSRITHRLFRSVQTPDPVARFEVGRLGFFVADTRIDRTEDRARLMRPEAFAQLREWVEGLEGPGVLIVGQPVLETRAGFFGRTLRRFMDWQLPDYDQYADLVRLFFSAPHSIVVLSGDVHFGRIGVCPLDPVRGTELVEIISSPLALVSPVARGHFATEPRLFPPAAIAGIVQQDVTYPAGYVISETDPSRVDNHFVTVDFTQLGAKIRFEVQAWRIRQDLQPPVPALTWSREVV
jgi:hypothetical protein